MGRIVKFFIGNEVDHTSEFNRFCDMCKACDDWMGQGLDRYILIVNDSIKEDPISKV